MKVFYQTQLSDRVKKFRIIFFLIEKKHILARHLILLPK